MEEGFIIIELVLCLVNGGKLNVDLLGPYLMTALVLKESDGGGLKHVHKAECVVRKDGLN